MMIYFQERTSMSTLKYMEHFYFFIHLNNYYMKITINIITITLILSNNILTSKINKYYSNKNLERKMFLTVIKNI